MGIQKVVVVDGNNLIVRIDRGVAGRSVTDVVPIEIDNALYLEFYFSDGTTETVGPVGTIQYIGTSPIVVTGSTISLSTVPVNLGGTGATTASGARTNLGLGSISTQDASSVAITGGSITGITDLAIADGGTGASTASGARTNLGLGTIATQDSSNVSITGGSITGITDLAIADGGTGASTASGARTNLGLGTSATLNAGVANGVATLDSGGTVPLSQIPASIQGGVSYQGAWNASTNTPTLTSSVGTKGYYYVVSVAGNTNLNGITDWVVGDWAIFNGSIWQKIDNTDAVTSVNGYTGTVVLTNTDISGFGTMSTQNANNVSITGGSITGITDLAVADGGTGASTASGARTNLGAAASGANSDITSMSGITGGIAIADYVTFDTSYTTTLTAGQLGWDGNNTLGLGMAGGNVVQRIGEDQFYYIKATSAITKGQVVMFTGAVGASGVVTGAPANGVTDGSYIMGIAAESIAANGFGLIQFEGTLRGFDTSAFSDGNILWYDPTVVGGLTATQPTAPSVKVQMCAVINAGNAGNGSVLIRVTPGSVLGGTDSNVQFTTLANGNLIQYDATAQYWKNVTPGSVAVTSFSAGSTGLTPSTATNGAVTLAGTLAIGYGGTGKTTATDAFNALAPSQTGNSGKYLTTDGTNTSWAANPLGTVTSVSGTGTVNGLTLTGTVTTSGNLTLGGTLDLSAPPAIGGTTPNTGAFTTLSASGNVTLSGGTANGVLYLNGSKVATSGSALTFDGTNFGLVGTGNRALSITTNTSGNPSISLVAGGVSSGFIQYSRANIALELSADGSTPFYSIDYTGIHKWFGPSNSEQMRLTSTGLGIGTSSVGYKLQVSSGATAAATYIASTATPSYNATSYNGANAILSLVSGGASGAYAGIRISQGGASEALFGLLQESGGAGAFVWQGYNGSSYVERMRLDSSGNLGIGTSSPASYGKLAVQTDGGTGNAIAAYSPSTTNGAKLRLYDNNSSAGIEGIPVAATASTDLSFVAGGASKMRLDSSGNLGLGVTPSAWGSYKALQVASTGGGIASSSSSDLEIVTNAYYSGGWLSQGAGVASSRYRLNAGTHAWFNAASGTAGNAITFTQAATLTANGNYLLGTTTEPTSTKSGNTYQAINSAVIEGTPYTTVSTSPVQLSRSSGVGLIAMISGYNTSGGAQGTWLVLVGNGVAIVVSSSDATATTPIFAVSSGKLTMQTTTGTLSVVCQIFTGA